MTKLPPIMLDDQLELLVLSQVREGRFESAADVGRAGLRLLQNQDVKLETLRAALIDGEQSGPSSSFDMELYIAAKRGTKSTSA